MIEHRETAGMNYYTLHFVVSPPEVRRVIIQAKGGDDAARALAEKYVKGQSVSGKGTILFLAPYRAS